MFQFVNINKRQFSRMVAKRVTAKNLNIGRVHIISVITILFEEVFKELLSKNKVKIGNFGTFILKKMKPRRHFNLTENKVCMSKGNKIFRFKLNERIKNIILESLDIEKTFLGKK